VAITDAAVAHALSPCVTEAEVAVHKRVHDAVLEKELVPFVPVPIDLAVEVIAVETLGSGVEVVVDVTLLIRQRDQVEHRHHRAVQAACGDRVDSSAAREYASPGAVDRASEGIEDHSLAKRGKPALGCGNHDRIAAGIENVRAQHTAEISSTQVGRRHRIQIRAVDALECPFPVREEEELVLLDRSAEVPAFIVLALVRLLGDAPEVLVPRERPQRIVGVRAERSAPKIIRPRLRDDVTAAPPVMPCSASKLLVEMLTSWMLSTGGTYTAW
jgi:hypothetical protein